MKARRLLSALLTVAMIATVFVAFGTVSYAAEVTADSPVITVSMEPDETVTVGEGEFGYKFVAKLSNYGTLTASDDDYSGRKLTAWQIKLDFPEGVYSNYVGKKLSSGLATKPSAGIDGNAFSFAFAAQTGDQQHPYEGSVSDEITLVTVQFKTLSNAFTLGVSGYLEISNTDENGGVPEGANTKYSTIHSIYEALNIPATLTVGEEEEKVVEIGTVSGATEAGAAVKPEYGTHKYDNAYVVTVNLTNEKNGDVVGVEFIPTEVLKYAGITESSTEAEINAVWATSAAKTTFGAVLGEGKAEYKAALINIPSFLAGTEFEIQARAFKTVGEDTTYAGAVKQKITYTVTAEPDRD